MNYYVVIAGALIKIINKYMRLKKRLYNGKYYIYKPMNVFEFLASLIMSSHKCVVCNRKEIWSVESWYMGGKSKVICDKCNKLNNPK